jgi:hypothetical protein
MAVAVDCLWRSIPDDRCKKTVGLANAMGNKQQPWSDACRMRASQAGGRETLARGIALHESKESALPARFGHTIGWSPPALLTTCPEFCAISPCHASVSRRPTLSL